MLAELAERELAEGVGGEELLSVLLLQRLVPVKRRELEHALALPSGRHPKGRVISDAPMRELNLVMDPTLPRGSYTLRPA